MSPHPDLGRCVMATCPECVGAGWTWPPNDDGSVTCADCRGSGRVKTWPDATLAQLQTVVNRAHAQMIEWRSAT